VRLQVQFNAALFVALWLWVAPLRFALAQTVEYEAATGDSMASLGTQVMLLVTGDTAYVEIYRSFAAVGDTTSARRQAIIAFGGVTPAARALGLHAAAILYLWPKEPSDSVLAQGPAAWWLLIYRQDYLGCWHIVNDTTPISTCVARDDPTSPGLEPERRWKPDTTEQGDHALSQGACTTGAPFPQERRFAHSPAPANKLMQLADASVQRNIG
jgi:hypothetical protein